MRSIGATTVTGKLRGVEALEMIPDWGDSKGGFVVVCRDVSRDVECAGVRVVRSLRARAAAAAEYRALLPRPRRRAEPEIFAHERRRIIY